MDSETLLKQVRENLEQAGEDQLESWHTQLSILYAWTAEQMATVKKNRALKEIEIKRKLLEADGKVTEDGIEREYFSSEEGQYLAFNQEYLKAIGRLITAVRYKRDAIKGKI